MTKHNEAKTKNIDFTKKPKLETVDEIAEEKKSEKVTDKENKKSKIPWRTLAVIAFLLIFILCTLPNIQ